jgi:DNA-directed RNA polymerase specialized sigma24 family protein
MNTHPHDLESEPAPPKARTSAIGSHGRAESSGRERRERVGAFFAAHATRLQGSVRAAARAPEAIIEDACQTAWAILLRRPDITLDDRGLSWLATVAIREAWRQASSARETAAGGFQGACPGDGELAEPADPDDRSAEQRALARIEHKERVQALATLKPREREALYLQGLGYSYQEIAKLSRGVRVNVAVLLGADVGDMSLMEASRLPFVRSEASGGTPAVAALARNAGVAREALRNCRRQALSQSCRRPVIRWPSGLRSKPGSTVGGRRVRARRRPSGRAGH